jgi:hypothetical protein
MTSGRTWIGAISWFAVMAACTALLAGCDDQSNAYPSGGGPGGSSPGSSPGDGGQGQAINQNAGGAGYGTPQDPNQFGDPSFSSGVTVAKIDTDGDPNESTSLDPNYNPETTGTVNGAPVNSAQYAYVVMSQQQMADSGVSIGDWALVTNTSNGQQVWARVEDTGPAGGTGEISEAAASAVGIQFQANSNTIGNPTVTVQAYAHTASIPHN